MGLLLASLQGFSASREAPVDADLCRNVDWFQCYG